MTKYQVSLTERFSVDWLVDVEADTEEQARDIARECYREVGSKERERDGEIDIDWVDEVQA